MNIFTNIASWFTGGTEYAYHTLLMCLDGDLNLAAALMSFGVLTFIAYVWIGIDLYNGRIEGTQKLLGTLFILCGFTSYAFLFVEFFWPGRRLQLIILILSCISSWAIVIRTKWFTTPKK